MWRSGRAPQGGDAVVRWYGTLETRYRYDDVEARRYAALNASYRSSDEEATWASRPAVGKSSTQKDYRRLVYRY